MRAWKWSARAARVTLTAALCSLATVVLTMPTAKADPAVGGEIVIIDHVSFGSGLTTNACGSDGQAALPMTIVATFINLTGNHRPTGPYAVGEWSGGFGSFDDHYGTSEAHDTTQVFHILLRSSSLSYSGPGEYSGDAIVQDVGTAGGIDEVDDLAVTVHSMPPFASPDSIKCPTATKFASGADYAKAFIKSFALGLLDEVCPLCKDVRSLYKQSMAYGSDLVHTLEALAEDDPPDDNFQQLPGPDPPPVLPAPSGLSAAQLTAFLGLEQALATAIGDADAMRTAVNRMWGAGNADSSYWYHRQAAALTALAGETRTALAALPAAYAAVQAAFTGDIPPFSIDEDTVGGFEASLDSGMPSDLAAIFDQLGVSSTDQRAMANDVQAVDESDLERTQQSSDLFTEPADFAGDAEQLVSYQDWAAGIADQSPPIVTGLDQSSAPQAGGTTLSIYGANLQHATGVSFGESTTDHNLGTNLDCSYAVCTVTVPPGTGTTDVTVDGPGGPSERTAADRLTYTAPTSPTVSRIFPATGSIAGGASISIFGSRLSDASIYFGPTLADDWSCAESMCTATVPASGQATTVDVQAVTPGGTSPPVAADRFTFSATEPPPPPPPAVTGISPAGTNVHGGATVTVTGTAFTDASAVQLEKNGEVWSDIEDFTVVDDSHLTFPAAATNAGTYDVVVTTDAGVSAIAPADRLTFTAGDPTITGVSPTSGPTTGGTRVTVTGTNLDDSDFAFGQSDAEAPTDVACTPTSCTMVAGPSSAGTVDIQATAGLDQAMSQLSAADRFTYVKAAAPTASRIAPATVSTSGGTPLAIVGTNLGGGSVSIGGQPAGSDTNGDYGDACQATSCLVATPTGRPGPQPIVITRLDGVSATVGTIDYVAPGPPVVTDVEPHSTWLNGSKDVVVVGHNLEDGSVYVGRHKYTAQADGVDCSPEVCTVAETGGSATGIVDITVHTPVGVSAAGPADQFTFYRPVITSVSPTTGFTAGGTPMTIKGSHLTDAEIFFGDAGADGFTCTDTTCTGPAPEVDGPDGTGGVGTVDITAQSQDSVDGAGVVDPTTSVTTTADKFTYARQPAPVVTAITPNSGTDEGGDQVTVTGNYLVGGTVTFYGDAVPSSCTQTQCTAVTPASPDETPQTDDVTVTTSSGTSSAIKFHYTAPAEPTITGVSPSTGGAGGGTLVAIRGTGLTNASISFGSAPASGVSCTATTCSAVSPTATAGTVDVRASTDGGTSATSTDDRFTYTVPPAPAVTAVSPAVGPASGGAILSVTGTDLSGGVVHIGATPTDDSVCTATSCTATQPPSAPGTVDVTVVTPGGPSPPATADRFTVSPIALQEVPVPGLDVTAQSGGGHVIGAPDGSMWFTMPSLEEIGKVAPDGTITTYPDLPAPDGSPALPVGIAITPDGTAWYTEENANQIVSISVGGAQHAYPLPGSSPDIRQLAVGPDGRLWFTLGGSGAIGAITTAGVITTYRLPDAFGYPVNLVAGPDRRIWFTEADADAIGAITTAGAVSEYPLAEPGAQPWGIAVGPDGRLWFTEHAGRGLGAITTAGAISTYPIPDGSPTTGIWSGPDGQLWFTHTGIDEISAFDPATDAATDFPLPAHDTAVSPNYLGLAADGSIWATEFTGHQLVHVTGTLTTATPTVGAVGPAYGPTGGGTLVTISGTDLGGATAVHFGSAAATSVTDVDPAHVTAVAPAGQGSVDVTVLTPHGMTPVGPADRFTYGAAPTPAPTVSGVTPSIGPTTGGTTITINGSDLNGATVTVGGANATSVSCTATSCTATTPTGSAGAADVIAHTSGGASVASAADVFTYLTPPPPTPVVTGVSPASGPIAGGTTVTISGTDLDGGTVHFGLLDLGGNCTATTCTMVTPAGRIGPVNVGVSTAGGESAATAAATFTYTGSVPGPPGRPSVKAGDGRVAVSWTAPANDGGSAISGYTLTVQPKGRPSFSTHLGNVRQTVVTGLTNGTSYTFTVRATNGTGTGPASAASAVAVPRQVITVAYTSVPSIVTYGARVKIAGKVSVRAALQVVLQDRPHGSGSYQTLATARSTSAGAVTFSVVLRRAVDVRLAVAAQGRYGAATSAARTISCRRAISAVLSPGRVAKGQSAVITGTVTPADKGAPVTLQRKVGTAWKAVATEKLATRSAYRFTIKANAKGTFDYRVSLPPSGGLARSTSATRVLRVT